MTDAIVVRGITADGVHGLVEERKHPQTFVVDVEIRGDLTGAAGADSIHETIDYGVLSKQVRDVIMNESFELIESLADAIARRLKELGASAVRVKVSKPRSARLLSVDEVAVVVER